MNKKDYIVVTLLLVLALTFFVTLDYEFRKFMARYDQCPRCSGTGRIWREVK
jgi:hypothetical protein